MLTTLIHSSNTYLLALVSKWELFTNKGGASLTGISFKSDSEYVTFGYREECGKLFRCFKSPMQGEMRYAKMHDHIIG